ncbi:unnamed protein product [Thelazia callipaeda]|uniref:Uncharacterized protein n=1 Tax=Thelazia callipaeda TaxID=103827 RepID=A0A0N5DB81_THECL|nr:unnamed protein product [Thelazia callipaeda]
MLKRINFGCVLGAECHDICMLCPTCEYAQNQMQRVLNGQQFDGQCKELESCAQNCINSENNEITDMLRCIFRDRCIKYCLDINNCPQCRDIIRRIFTGYCYRNKYIKKYGTKCRPLFDYTVQNYTRES